MPKSTSEISLAGFRISRDSTCALYQQVYEQFREMILSGRLKPGDRLPSTRILASEIGVSRTIITQSFEQLILEGYLVGKVGSGTFVSATIPEQLTLAVKPTLPAQKAEGKKVEFGNGLLPAELLNRNCNKEDLVPFQTGTPAFDFFPYKIWHQVTAKVVKKLKTYHLGYGDALGYLPLREEIANYLRVARAVKCEPEQVVIVTGSQQGLNLVTECLLKKEDSVWMEDPGYHGAKFSLLKKGVKICPIPIQKDGLDIYYGICKCPEAKFAYTTPSHQFPLGVTLSLTKRLELLEWSKQNKMWIFEDDYDSEFRYEGRPLASMQGLDSTGTVIYSGTFSKVLFPGLRLAYLVLPSIQMAREFKKVKAMLDRHSPILEQIIVSQFMAEGHFLRHLRKMRLLYAERRNLLLKLSNEILGDYLKINEIPSGMNITGTLSEKVDPRKLKIEVQNHHIIVPFVDEYALENFTPDAIILGYTAFSKYKLKTGLEKLRTCMENAAK